MIFIWFWCTFLQATLYELSIWYTVLYEWYFHRYFWRLNSEQLCLLLIMGIILKFMYNFEYINHVVEGVCRKEFNVQLNQQCVINHYMKVHQINLGDLSFTTANCEYQTVTILMFFAQIVFLILYLSTHLHCKVWNSTVNPFWRQLIFWIMMNLWECNTVLLANKIQASWMYQTIDGKNVFWEIWWFWIEFDFR